MEVLSQKEVDELLAALAAGQLGGQIECPVPVREPAVQVYDFRRPNKFSKDHLRALQIVHDNFARLWTTALSAHLRAMTKVTLEAVEQMTFDEFLNSVSNPGVLCLLSLDPLPGRQMVDIHPGLAFPVIDRLLGGLGAPERGERGLTEIEVTVIERVGQSLLDALGEAWHGLVSLRPHLEGIETNPLFAQVIPPNEVTVVITFSAHLQEAGGNLRLCLPYSSLKPVLTQLTTHRWSGGGETLPPGKNGSSLKDIKVEVVVRLGRATLTVGQLLNLERGDVIRLDQPVARPLLLFLGPRPALRVRPGRVGNRIAVQVIETLVGEEEGDE